MEKKKNNNSTLLVGIIGVVVLVVVILLICILLSNKKVVCTMKSDQSKNGYVLETEYIIKANGKNVKTVDITETVTSKDKKKLSKFEKDFNDNYAYNKKNYGGYTYKVTNKDGKVVTKVTINYNKFDMEKFIKNNEAMKKYTEKNKLTLDGAKKLYESTGAKCK